MPNGDGHYRSSRRNALKAIGTGIVTLGVSAGSGVASSTPEALPTEAVGRRIHHFRPDGDEYYYRQQFVSPDLAKYGTRAVSFAERTIPRETIPESYRETGRAFTIQHEDAGVFGTLEEHVNVEQRLNGLDERAVNGDVDLQSTDSYVGPQYVYESAEGAEDRDLSERKAPINVAWNDNVGKYASDIDQYMYARGWGGDLSDIVSWDRYVAILTDTGSYYAKLHDEDIGKTISGTAQYHIRLWDMGNYLFSDYRVCGQVHRDPYDHGTIQRLFKKAGVWDGPDWKLMESRDEVLSDWSGWGYETDEQDLNNEMDGHDGVIGTIYQ